MLVEQCISLAKRPTRLESMRLNASNQQLDDSFAHMGEAIQRHAALGSLDTYGYQLNKGFMAL